MPFLRSIELFSKQRGCCTKQVSLMEQPHTDKIYPRDFFTAAKPFSAAAIVRAISSSVCAPEKKIVSNYEGAR